MKDCNTMIDGKKSIWSTSKNDLRTDGDIQNIATGQGDDCTTGCLQNYHYFKENYKMMTKDLSKQQAHNTDPKLIQKINFTRNLDHPGITTVSHILQEVTKKKKKRENNKKKKQFKFFTVGIL